MRAVDATGTREIEEAVQKALAAGGIQGTVALTGRTMTLRSGGAPVEIDAAYLVEQWPLLPEDLRERKATDVAARLTDALRAAKAGTPAPAAPTKYTPSARPTGAPARGPGKPMVLPLGTVLLVAGLAAAAWWFWTRARPMGTADSGGTSAGAGTTSAAPETDDQRRARVCEVARKRVLETRSLAGLDAQVWLTELWLATSRPGDDMTRTKAVTDLVDPTTHKLTPAADPDLAAIAEAQVELDAGESAARAGVPWRGVHVRFKSGYVSAFFETAGREKLLRVANKLADATGAEMGAMYARCAHLRYHDVGAWFRGATPSQAASSLVYSMGFFSERRLTNHDPSAPPTASDLVSLTAAMTKVEKGAFEAAVREVGGTYAPGAGNAPTVISFPLGGPTLAARAAGSLATTAGRGPDAPRPEASP